MIDKKSITESILNEIKQLAFPNDGFGNYMCSKMYDYYSNFLEYVFTFLLDDYSLDIHIKKGTFDEWGLKKETINYLANFSAHLKKFYNKHEESNDFTLLRDNYWEEFSEEAKKCVELLERDLKLME